MDYRVKAVLITFLSVLISVSALVRAYGATTDIHHIFTQLPIGAVSEFTELSADELAGWARDPSNRVCSPEEFGRAIVARALIEWIFHAARTRKAFKKSQAVVAGFYTVNQDAHYDSKGYQSVTTSYVPVLLTIIPINMLQTVNPKFGDGGVTSNGDVLSDKMCAMGEVGSQDPGVWSGYMALTETELDPFVKVFVQNGGTFLVNPKYIPITLPNAKMFDK